MSVKIDEFLFRIDPRNSTFFGIIFGEVNKIWEDTLARVSLMFLSAVIVIAILGPELLPYHYTEVQYSDGELLRLVGPSLAHPLGTDPGGRDLFVRLIYGTRPTIITGLLGGAILITIGTIIGVTSGYVGGRVDSFLMGLTDFAFSVPLLPFSIVLVGLIDIGFLSVVLVIGLILWRASARVIRSQVLQIKQQPYVKAAKAEGAGTTYIMVKHILPNVSTMAILYFALGVGWAILLQAGLAFLGVVNPFVPSWGVMIRNAYKTGNMTLWTWSLPPGVLLSATVTSAFLIGRRYEAITGQDAEKLLVESSKE